MDHSASANDVTASNEALTAALAQLTALQARLASVESELSTLRASAAPAPAAAPSPSAVSPTATSRRGLLALAGGAAAAAVVGSTVAGSPSPVAAANGDPITVAQRSVPTALSSAVGTELDYGGVDVSGPMNYFTVHDFNGTTNTDTVYPATIAGWAYFQVPVGVYGFSATGGESSVGTIGRTVSSFGTGVLGLAEANGGVGVLGRSNAADAAGVFGESVDGAGTWGRSSNNVGTRGESETGVGVEATSDSGVALSVAGSGRVLLSAHLASGAPTSGEHDEGEIVRDGEGDLYLCYATGTPGSWRKLGGGTTAGALHVITPARVFDSRLPGGGGRLSTGQNRVVSVANSINLTTGAVATANLVPAGATAIAYNLTITGATQGGFLAVTPGDVTTFSASTINWTANTTDLANGTLVKLSANRQVRVSAGGGGSTDFVIDVTGYYR